MQSHMQGLVSRACHKRPGTTSTMVQVHAAQTAVPAQGQPMASKPIISCLLRVCVCVSLLAAGPIVSPATHGSVQLDSLRVNSDGSMVCALASVPGSGGGCQDPRLFVYSAGRNGPLVMDLSADMTAPRAVAWDVSDPRLLAVQTGALVRSQGGSRPSSGDGTAGAAVAVAGVPGRAAAGSGSDELLARSSDVATVFATGEAGLLLQEYQDLDPASSGCVGFLGVSAPHLLLLRGSAAGAAHSGISSGSGSGGSLFAAVPLRCFSGLADADEATRRALLNFNYLLAVGRLDEAFRVVSALKSPAVWRNMAHMAIKNKQLAVAGGRRDPEGAETCPQHGTTGGVVLYGLSLTTSDLPCNPPCCSWWLVTTTLCLC